MTDTADSRFLEVFPGYLRTLGEDAAALGEVLANPGGEETQRYVAAGLNYIFKSLDLIPDGIDDLGFMDDAFVLRVAASLAVATSDTTSTGGVLSRLAREANDVREFLSEDYERLEGYVRGLRKGTARGRTVDDILTDEEARGAFTREIAAWAKEYQTPTFARDVKTLIKLRAFLNAKLS